MTAMESQFDSACDYLVKGDIPPARFWTFTLLSPVGDLIANKADRQGFTSSELLRANNGQFAVALSTMRGRATGCHCLSPLNLFSFCVFMTAS